MGCNLSTVFQSECFEIGCVKDFFNSFDSLSIFVRHNIDNPLKNILFRYFLFRLLFLCWRSNLFRVFLLFRVFHSFLSRFGRRKRSYRVSQCETYD